MICCKMLVFINKRGGTRWPLYVAIAKTTLTLPTKPSVHYLSAMLILWLLYQSLKENPKTQSMHC